MELLTVLGARPQFIKAAALSATIKASRKLLLNETILHTGQHYDDNMSSCFFSELDIPEPEINLGVGGGTHGRNTGQMLERIERVLLSNSFEGVIVYGDTDSTIAGALAASKLKIPVFHIESGLRSFYRHQPEEQNRVLTDHLSTLCFAPTPVACSNLRNEAIPEERIVLTGDIMVDSIRLFGEVAGKKSKEYLKRHSLSPKEYILATIHRAENTDDPNRLSAILSALSKSPLPVVMPLHPRTTKKINEFSFNQLLADIVTIPPVGYIDMLILERNARVIATDSGGVQKEAFLNKVPCVTFRRETEWIELVQGGWNILADPSSQKSMLGAISQQLSFKSPSDWPNIYGDGFASHQIIAKIHSHITQN